MPTLRDQLMARRNAYLERSAVFDDMECPEPVDIRVVQRRRFLEGGDDIPPECEEKGTKRERRRIDLSLLLDPEKAAAAARLNDPNKNEPADEGDWDRFVVPSGTDYGLYRITAQLVRATEYWHNNVLLPIDQVLDLQRHFFSYPYPIPRLDKLPGLDETPSLPVPASWILLRLCGCDPNILKRSYQSLIDKAGEVTRYDGNINRNLSKELSDLVDQWLNSFSDPKSGGGQQCPSTEPLPPRSSNTQCPCQREKPSDTGTSGTSKNPNPLPTLEQARLESAEAVLAAFNTDSAQFIVDEFRAINIDDLLIAQILLWLQDRWNAVAPSQKYDSAGQMWQMRNEEKRPQIYNDPDQAPEPGSFSSLHWSQAKEKFNNLRAIPQYFMALSQKKVREICVEIFKSLWSNDDDMPFKTNKGGNDTDLAKSAGLDRNAFLGAVDRAAARDDCPFRLAALLQAPVGYMRVLDQLPISAEQGTGADGLARPPYKPLSAFYWRAVVIPKTIGHILTMIDTADFHAVEHIRFLGLFRPGGKYRTGKPENQDYENWIKDFVPAWLTDFIKAALLRFKYWLDDRPLGELNDKEEMTYWSENHQMLFGSSEYIAGSWWHDEVFTYTGKGNFWHYNRALPRVRAWLDHRLQFGFSEVNSGTYYNQHLPGIFNLVDFADEEEIHKKALMVLDLMVFDIVRRTCVGSFVAASGRAYWSSKRSGWSVSIVDFIQVLTGTIGDHWNAGENTACSFVTSQYLNEVPEALIAMGIDRSTPVIDRSRTSINLQDGSQYGLDYESSDSIVFWWGCGAYYTNETFDATESWSYRWSLRQSDPFKLFKWINNAIVRLFYAVAGLLISVITFNITTFLSGVFSLNLMSAVMLTPRLLRGLIDVVLTVVDAYIIEIIVQTLKWAGALDENDDCVRVARSAVEQEFRTLLIEFNRGSVLGRQHIYGWRSADAMLTSLVDDNKGGTSFQKESCIANLGMNVSVFTGKRLNIPGFGGTVGNIVEGFTQGLARYGYDPDTSIISQIPFTEGESAPEIGGVLVPIFGSKLGNDGPAYWFGNVSAPLVFQNENVAISIYSPTELQKDLAPESTHAHWPWDHFDEVRTEERNGGRWVFGRRDRRFPPRTPCEPRPERRPSAQTPWPSGKWREEHGAGSGYIALFSARGMKTTPVAGQEVYDQLPKDNNNFPQIPADPTYYGHRELIADGHDNIWITIVGDRMTYMSFDAFCSEVLAAQLDVDLDHLQCAITMPLPGVAVRNEKGPRFEVSWDHGGKIDGQEMKTDAWPRFEQRDSSLKAQQGLSGPLSDLKVTSVHINSKADPAKGRVDWDEKAWRVEVTILSWQQVKDEQGRINFVQVPALLYLEHDFTQEDMPRRETSPEGIQAFRDRMITSTSVVAGVSETVLPPAKSVLGSTFRQARSNFKLRRR